MPRTRDGLRTRFNNTLDNFKVLFKVGFSKDTRQSSIDRIQTYKVTPIEKGGKTFQKVEREVFPEEVKALASYWMNNCHDSLDSWRSRQELYQDMDMLYYNSVLISRAIELVADECIQADSNDQFIFIEAKPNIKQDIQEFFDKISLTEKTRPTILDIIQYGNAGWVLDLTEGGVGEVISVDIRDIKDRLQFTPFEVAQKMRGGTDNTFSNFKSIDRMKQLLDTIENTEEDYLTRFKSYCFGFQIGDYVIPPWSFIHFRNMTNKSVFKPFGVPVFIHSVAPYRQLDAAMTLNVLAKGASFPRSVYKLNFPNSVNPADKLEKAVEFMKELQNAGINQTSKEDMGVGEVLVTIKDLYEFELESPDINVSNSDEINTLRDDLIISTMLPRSLLDPNDGTFGTSGVSLTEQFKPFARMIYRIQSAYLQGLTQLVKIHLIQSNKYALEDIDFILSMPYPESQTNQDIISSQNSLLDLAGNVVAALEDKLMGGEKLPLNIIKSIYQKFLPYDDDVIEKWLSAGDNKKDNEKLTSSYTKWSMVEKEIGKVKLQETINEAILENKQTSLREGVMGKRHYYSSRIKDDSFPAEKLRELDIKLTASEKGEKLEEEVKVETYKFKPEFIEANGNILIPKETDELSESTETISEEEYTNLWDK